MIHLLWKNPQGVEDVRALVQTAIDLEFSTLPPYLYAKFSLLPEKNNVALQLLNSVVGEEMIHMCLACNIMNAIGGQVSITPPKYPGPLPGDVDADITVHLLPFSPEAMQQGMNIESPVHPLEPPVMDTFMLVDEEGPVSIGVFYKKLEEALKALPANEWIPDRNQFSDAQYFQGQLFAVNGCDDASRAINNIVSEGEGSPKTATEGSPLDFEGDIAHYYRFEELYRNKILTKDVTQATGYVWGADLGVDWAGIYNALSDPQTHDFSREPKAAIAAQRDCNLVFSTMVDELCRAFRGEQGRLGNAIRAMFDLRMAATKALTTPLNCGQVAGPGFQYVSQTKGAAL